MKKTKILCECAILLALSIVLSYVKVYEAPFGGSVTLLSMLPILLVGLKNGTKWGLGTAFVFALFQLIQGLTGGNVFPYCYTWQAVVICVLFDYAVPFTVLGLSGLASAAGKGLKVWMALAVSAGAIVVRFLCHYITGVVIWGQWAPEGMGKYLYSLIYNVQYMAPELVLTLVGMGLLLASPQIKRLIEGK